MRSSPSTRGRYWIVAAGIATLILLIFLVVEAAGIPILTDPSAALGTGGPLAALAGVGLLVVDVVLPVPSSLVMVAHGALFGLWPGMALSLIGSVGASLVAFVLGRSASPAIERFVTPEEYRRAGALLERWGVLAIVVTRPVPILAETVSILAGASPLAWTQVALASVLGVLPAAFLYALAGAMAVSVGSELLVFGVVLLITGVLWWLGRSGFGSGRARTVVGRRVEDS